jgi:cyclic pyranopterin phosphate synthase
MKHKLTHLDSSGNPKMVDVAGKKITLRKASAQARVWLGAAIIRQLEKNDLMSGKGPVFQTAILAGIQGAKKTADLIPLCHPMALDDCSITIRIQGEYAVVDAAATVMGKTGVEMEALTAAAVASLTIYDMCKALSHEIRIESIQLMGKTGGKKDFQRK